MGVAVLLVLLALYTARKVIAREVLTGWLRAHGVAAQLEVDGLGLGAFGGRLRLGDPRAPDATVDDVRITYGLRGLSFEVRSVTLRAPVLRARLHGGKLSLGALDPLIEELRRRPPQPDTGQPRIAIEGGVLLLTTDYGPLRLAGDATLEDGRLTRLAVRADPARLHGAGFDVATGAATASVRTTGPRLALALEAPLNRLQAGRVTATGARLTLTATAPYPDLKRQRLDGAVTLRAGLAGGQLDLAGDSLAGLQLNATVDGQAAGGIGDFALNGLATVDLRSSGGTVRGARIGGLRASVKASDLRWTRPGGDAVAATPRASLLVQTVDAGDLRLAQIRTQVQGPVSFGSGVLRAALTGGLDGRGAWRGLGAVAPADDPTVAAAKRAAQGFRFVTTDARVDLAAGVVRVALPRPARVLADSGGVLTVSGRSGGPVVGPDGGRLSLALKGGGLPMLNADLRRLAIAAGGVTAEGVASVAGSFGPAREATLNASGTLSAQAGILRFTAARCAPFTARKLAFGANDVEGLAGRFCPWDGPVFILAKGDWRLRGQVEGLNGETPFLQARLAGGAARVTAAQTSGRLAVTAVLDAAKVSDTARQTRFNALRMGGTAGLADAVWTADLAFTTPGGKSLGDARLRQNTRDGRGGLTLDTGALVFADGGLQPLQLSPLAVVIASPAEGQARFAGHVDWTPGGTTSGGTLSVPSLDFQSAAGKVSGLKGEIVFSSLAPLIAAPGQMLRVESIAALVPITGVTAGVSLDDKALTITGGEAAVGGGRVRIESLSVPLAPDAAMTGVLVLEGVQLHDLVEASPFGDRVDLDAKVSGRVPFQSLAGKVRVTGAEVHAIQPGRLSIARQALTGVAAGGALSAALGPGGAAAAAAVAANDTFTDFAYQAMENLAFDKLDAAITSRDDGRLGVLAHIVGRHDPPKHQEIRLSLFDLIGRKFLTKPLPLPSDTGVDLTLDTTLNLDDLLADYAAYRDLRGSPPVQPPAPITAVKPPETPK
ncbi:YdbH domain-containing protein [Phenylobacterium sp.]|uniref:intermembrane phospholipid transport protein YdbH family protein n=1 Tax=Phenylobacterium sp. TaxID=1871053 RepID=UPI00374D8019